MNKILQIVNLSKNYHDKTSETLAINNINLDIYDKEIVSIVGPSGCGKSTLLSILSGLTNPSSGKIIMVQKKNMGYMLQNDSLFYWRTILNNCLLGLELNNNLTKDNIDNVKKMLNHYGLKDFIDKYPNSLSGGMRQRVALIRTLATNPDILLLDEPYSALDYQTRLKLSDDLYKIIREKGKTAIFITHDIAEAISISNRVVVLSKRPANIKKIYNIKLDNPSTPTQKRKDAKFNYYYDLIWRDIDENI